MDLPQVFISYGREDKEFVLKIKNALEEANHDTWIDLEDIPPSTLWWNEILEGIEKSDIFVFVVSPDSLTSPVCHLEIKYAQNHNKRIIPIRYKDVVRNQVLDDLGTQELHDFIKSKISKVELINLAKENLHKLSQQNWILFDSDHDFGKNSDLLIDAVNTDYDYIKKNTHFLRKAIEWKNQSKSNDYLLRGEELNAGIEFISLSEGREISPASQLQITFIETSQAIEVAQNKKRKRITWGIIIGVLSLIVVPYLWMSIRYYISLSPGGHGIVVKAGDPGIKLLPFFDWVIISTEYRSQQISDYQYLRDEELKGFWVSLTSQISPWALQTIDHMEPAPASLEYWRLGEMNKAKDKLQQVAENADYESVETITYLALLYEDAVGPVIDELIEFLYLDDEDDYHQDAIKALEIIRETQKVAADQHLEVLFERLPTDGDHRIALLKALVILSQNREVENQLIIPTLLDLIANLQDIDQLSYCVSVLINVISRNPQEVQCLLDQIFPILEDSDQESQAVLIPILAYSTYAPDSYVQFSLQLISQFLNTGEEQIQIAGIQILDALASNPHFSDHITEELLIALLEDGSYSVKRNLLEKLPDIMEGLPENERLIQKSIDISEKDYHEDVRREAVKSLGVIFQIEPQLVFDSLIVATRDEYDLVRWEAIDHLIRIALDENDLIGEIEPILFSMLSDRDSGIQMESAFTLLMLGDPTSIDMEKLVESFYTNLDIYDQDYYQDKSDEYSSKNMAQFINETASHCHVIPDEIVDDVARFAGKQVGEHVTLLPEFSNLLINCSIKGESLPYYSLINYAKLGGDAVVKEAIDLASQRLTDPDPLIRGASVRVLSYLAINHDYSELALERLIANTTEQDDFVNSNILYARGFILRNDNSPSLAHFAEPTQCANYQTSETKIACVRSMSDIGTRKEAPHKELCSEIARMLDDEDEFVRKEAALALIEIEQANPGSALNTIDHLQKNLSPHNNIETNIPLLAALGVINGDDPSVFELILEFAEEYLIHENEDIRRKTINMLGYIGEQHPELAPKIFETINPSLKENNIELLDACVWVIRDLGLSNIENTRLSLPYVRRLLSSPNLYIRTITLINYVDTLLERYPEVAEEVLPVVDVIYEDIDQYSNEDYYSLVLADAWEARRKIYSLLAEDDIDRLWRWVVSKNFNDRELSREAMLSVLNSQPDLRKSIEDEFNQLNQSKRAHIRDNSAKSLELIRLLDIKHAYLEGTDISCPWVDAIDWFWSMGNELLPAEPESVFGDYTIFSNQRDSCSQ